MSRLGGARLGAATLAAAFLVAGCGGGAEQAGGETAEARDLLQQLKALGSNEILIKGMSRSRVYGPYTFVRGGYVFRFSQEAASSSEAARIAVALESKAGSRRQPYDLLVDGEHRSGRAVTRLSGRLYVHVIIARRPYLLRFTPQRALAQAR